MDGSLASGIETLEFDNEHGGQAGNASRARF